MSHNASPVAEVTADEFTRDVVARHIVMGSRYRMTLLITGALLVLGIVGFAARALGDGFDDRLPWGYYVATMVFLLTTAGSAPVVIVTLRMTKAHWIRPMARVSEIYAAVGVLTFIMFVPILFLVPSADDRFSLWFQGDTKGALGSIPGAPHVYIGLLLALLFVTGLVLLHLSTRPDRVAVRDLSGRTGGTGAGWYGSRKEWLVMRLGLGMMGGFYFLLLIGTLSLFSVDFGMALVPGWKDAIFPAFQSVNGLQAGLATVVVTAYLVRRYGGFEKYIHMEQFWGASKILLALSLFYFYFWWSGFIIFWYGKTPIEQTLLDLLYFGPYRVLFFLGFFLSFLAPFLILMWNAVRKTTWGPSLAAALILVGMLVDKIRIYVAVYSVDAVSDIADHALEVVPATHYPDVFDLMIVIGGISGGIFLVMLATRIAPVFSLWEMTEGIRLRVVKPFLRTEVVVIGKPE
jgi:hypothetical protein